MYVIINTNIEYVCFLYHNVYHRTKIIIYVDQTHVDTYLVKLILP